MLTTGDMFVWALVLMRIIGLMLVVPFFSHSSIPVIARIGFASAFAIIVFPLVELGTAYPTEVGSLVIWVAKEMSVGLCLGLAVRMVFFVLDFAAHILTVEIGLMPSPEFDPSNANSFNPLGSIFYFFGMVILLSGTEYDILLAYIDSYQVAPINYWGLNEFAIEEIVVRSMGVFKIGILMAAPIIAVNFLVNLIFAVLGKVVPKLNVFILSFSARIMAGIAVLALSVVLFVHYILAYFEQTPDMMLRFVLFRPDI